MNGRLLTGFFGHGQSLMSEIACVNSTQFFKRKQNTQNHEWAADWKAYQRKEKENMRHDKLLFGTILYSVLAYISAGISFLFFLMSALFGVIAAFLITISGAFGFSFCFVKAAKLRADSMAVSGLSVEKGERLL